MKITVSELKDRLNNIITDQEVLVSLLEDIQDSFGDNIVEENEENNRIQELETELSELQTQYEELRQKYKERFLSKSQNINKDEDEDEDEEKIIDVKEI